MELSVVVPAFNEARRLDRTLPEFLDLLDDGSTELIFVDDGSTDCTLDLLATRLRGFEGSSVLRRPHRGKGAAVRAGMARARGDVVVYMDADLSSDLGDLPRLVAELEHCEVAMGSRSVPGSEVIAASRARSTLGATFNRVVRGLTGLPMRDTQCGFKGFRASAAGLLFQLSQIDGWAFDVELLVIARHLGLEVHEVPIHWHESPGSHVRPFRDALYMPRQLARLNRGCPTRRSVAAVRASPGDGMTVADTAARVRKCVRRYDTVAVGDTALLALLPHAEAREAAAVAKRLGKQLPDVAFEVTALGVRQVQELFRPRLVRS